MPGISRVGRDDHGRVCARLSRKAATEFSFFLAMPVMLAATLYDLSRARCLLTAADVPVFAVGFVVSFISALLVVKAFILRVAP